MLKSMNFLSGKSRGRVGGGTKLAPLAPVILGPVPRILLQRVSNLVNKLALLAFLCLFTTAAEAKICFLPDGSCGTGKITGFDPNPNPNGCQYKSRTEAEKGMGECEEAYSPDNNPCWYRRCDSDNTTIFNDYASCQKILSQKKDKDKYECNSCGSCYKLVAKTTPPDDTTCTTKADCDKENKGFESNNTYDSNGNECGICKVNESCHEGYSTNYQSQSDCLTGESFSSSGSVNGKVCGKCTADKPQTCESMGYETDYCSKSCERAYKTGKQDYEGNDCYRCEAYDCNKKCSELNPNWIGEDVDCKDSGVPGPFWSIEWVYDEAGEPILGSDSDCKICKTLNEVTIVTADSPCYKISSITGSNVQKISDKNYRVDLGSDITVNTEAINKESRYCKYPNNILSVNNNNKYTVKNNSRNFTLNTEFLNENNISSSSKFTIAAVDDVDPIEYVAKIVIENTEEELCESNYSDDCYCVIYTDLYIDMDNATDDTFMNGSDFEPKLDLRNASGNMYSGLLGGYVFDGNRTYDWQRNASTNGDACNPVYASKKSEYYFYWGKNKEKIKMPYNSSRACIQVGTKADNTRVCYEIENN